MSRYKRLTIQIGELSLEGLDIDWHLAEYDYPAAPIAEKSADYQPTYAAA